MEPYQLLQQPPEWRRRGGTTEGVGEPLQLVLWVAMAAAVVEATAVTARMVPKRVVPVWGMLSAM